MNKITAVIIEDEIPAARRLNNTLNELRPEYGKLQYYPVV